jgi:phenylalanyl-tRNA synthetase beta chain
MRVSLNWLKDFVDIDMSPADLADLLTMSSLEVETVDPVGQSLQDVVAAKILSVKPHPKADRLSICEVDTGRGEVPVICGAPNAAAGAVSAMALPGTTLPGGMVIKETRIRGERSVGMLLAEDEMGLTDDHSGIMILPPGVEPGTPVRSVLPLEDHVLEIGITPNRPDCASVIGIAREIAALTGQRIKRPETRFEEENTPIEDLARVTLEDPVGCPRYAAGMIRGVELKPSPFWMRYRLHVCGLRGINNVVDVTNYVLLEMNQPLHSFDYDRLRENRIVVRRAGEGETFTTLDGETQTLNGENLMICDGQRSVALAGIMGGLNSEIFAGTENVLIESAFFDPITIRRGSKRLGLLTEASYRFERGIDIDGVTTALKRALHLMHSLGGGKIARGIIDEYPSPCRPRTIDLRVDRTNRFLGTSLSREVMAGYLAALEMDVRDVNENVIRVKPPAFRVDVTREEDLMEDVARLEGYDKIPVTSPPVRPHEGKAPELVAGNRTREIMAGLGFSEIISFSFISPDSADMMGAEEKSELRSFVRLLNPLSVDQSVMRTSLVPGLLLAVKTNVAHGEGDLRLFEWGNRFLARGGEELPHEEPTLAAVMTGLVQPKTWFAEGRKVDFHDIKGAVEGCLKALGLREFRFYRGEGSPVYHPEVSALVEVSGVTVGQVGQVASEVLERYDLGADNVYLFELNMEALMEEIRRTPTFVPFAKYPAVLRDMSLVVEKELESAKIREIIEREGGALIESVILYDLYEGGKMGPSEKALTFRIRYRSREGTLDGKDINRLHETIVERIESETGGRLREG